MHHAYERISRDPDLASEAIDRQRVDNKARAKELGWTDLDHIVDRNRSAWRKTGSRKGFNQLIRLIEDGETEGIVVWDLDRLLRRADELEILIKAVEARPVPVVTAKGDFDLTDSSGKFTARVLVAAAQKSSDDTQRRIRRQMEGREPRVFGYAYQRENYPVIRRMAKELIAGRPLSEVAQRLNEAGHRTRLGNSWTYMSVGQVITHPETMNIIGEAQWIDCQVIVERGRGRRAKTNTHTYYLKGLMICSCGHTMVGCGYNRDDGKYVPRYACLRRDGGCGVGIDANKVEHQVRDWVQSKLEDGTLTRVSMDGPMEPSIADTLAELDLDYYSRKLIPRDRYLSVKADLEAQAAQHMTKQTSTMTLKEFKSYTAEQLHRHLPRVLEAVYIMPATPGKHYDASRVTILGRAPRPAKVAS